jgi:hypothetical protein
MNIIGVDHVQFALPDVIAGAALLSRYGYELDFVETDFNTKRRSYFRGETKSMAYLHRGTSRVEVITSAAPVGSARYTPTADGIADPTWPEGPARATARGVDGVIVRTRQADASAVFWQLLGFMPTGNGGFAFPANMFSMPLTVSLDRDAPEEDADAMADDAGCSSIALITRSLMADRPALSEAGYPVSEATPFRINGRRVTICFVTGPGGELVELVEFGRP